MRATIPQNVVESGTQLSWSAGAPNPSSAMTRMVGTPRKKSAYAMPSARIGKKTGPGRLRTTASRSARTRMNASAIMKIFTFSRNAREISGIDDLNWFQLKNVRLTSGQPGACVIATASKVKKTTVLSTATVTPRRPSPAEVTLPMIFEPRFVFRRLFQHGRVGLEPLALQARERAVRAELRQRAVDAAYERVSLCEDHPEVLRRSGRRELAQDLALRDLHGRDVERRRQVDHEAVDLLVLESGDRGIVLIEHGRLLRRLDVVDDVVVARRSQLGAELVRLERRDRRCARDRRSLHHDERLVDVVVRVAEVDCIRPCRLVRDLVDVEVELLRARCEGGVERNDDPLHLALGEAELRRDRVRDGTLIPLAGVGIAYLPRGLLGTAEPGRECRIVRPDRQLARMDEIETALGARRHRGGRRGVRGLVARAAAACGETREQNDQENRGSSAHEGD